LQVQFSRLQQRIRDSEDFESVKQAHQDYLNSLVGQSFLQMKPISRSLDDLFSLCLQFCNYVSTTSEIDLNEIDGMVKQFRRFATFLLTILRGVKRKLQSSPYLTNLSQLLMRLDYNSYFSDLADRSRVA
jgi:gamma-tubulin complex component 4